MTPGFSHLAIALNLGRGRLIPLLLLGFAAILLYQADHTPLAELRASLFDRYQRLAPRERPDEPVVVVGIDSQSLVEYGQWPWRRDLLARLLDRIQADQPLAIGLDIVFAERDQSAPELLARRLPTAQAALLDGLPDPDRVLADALGRAPSVLASIGLPRRLPGARAPHSGPPLISPDPAVNAWLPQFPAALSSLPMLQQAAAGEGLINATPGLLVDHAERGVIRRVPGIALIEQRPVLALPLEMVRQALGGGSVALEGDGHGVQAIRIGDYRLPTGPNGEVFLHFGPSTANYTLSARDVLAGNYAPNSFRDRFVIVGLLGAGLQDRVITPLGDSLPGVDIHVQMIESLLAGHALQRPAWMPTIELGVLLAGGLLLVAAIPVLRPRLAGLSFLFLGSTILAAGYLLFLFRLWLFDASSIVLLLAPCFMALLANTLIAADARRRQAEHALQQSREAAARVAGELGAARTIQMGMLPDPAAVLRDDPRIEAAALLEPASAVGGDYYDCFKIDDNHLCIAIADVSGKGVPASLFMAIAKALGGALMRRHAGLPAAVGALVDELERENPTCLFITAFIAIIDLEHGEMEYLCAGHDAPLLRRNGEISRIDTDPVAGPPLCALSDFPYATGRHQLQAGDLLCLFTDGASEAGNGQEIYGSQRLAAAFGAADSTELNALAAGLRDDIRCFEAGSPPADDLTLLLVRWLGQR